MTDAELETKLELALEAADIETPVAIRHIEEETGLPMREVVGRLIRYFDLYLEVDHAAGVVHVRD